MGPTQLPVGPPPQRYALTALGAFTGGVTGGAAGLLASRAITAGAEDAASKSFFVVGIIFSLIWLCTTAGAWLALRARRDPIALRTTFMVGAGVLAWSVISIPSLFWTLDMLPSEGLGELAGGLGLAAMLTVPPALAARWIILTNEKLPEREET